VTGPDPAAADGEPAGDAAAGRVTGSGPGTDQAADTDPAPGWVSGPDPSDGQATGPASTAEPAWAVGQVSGPDPAAGAADGMPRAAGTTSTRLNRPAGEAVSPAR
jgi:hypothetical protein